MTLLLSHIGCVTPLPMIVGHLQCSGAPLGGALTMQGESTSHQIEIRVRMIYKVDLLVLDLRQCFGMHPYSLLS
jgi:hypothetical protein